MIEAVLQGLIWLGLLVLAVVVIRWALEQFGIGFPEQVWKIFYVLIALVAILILVRTILPHAGIRLGQASDPVYERLAADIDRMDQRVACKC